MPIFGCQHHTLTASRGWMSSPPSIILSDKYSLLSCNCFLSLSQYDMFVHIIFELKAQEFVLYVCVHIITNKK